MFSNFIGFVYVGGDPPKSPLKARVKKGGE
jgi:hypothetical protein